MFTYISIHIYLWKPFFINFSIVFSTINFSFPLKVSIRIINRSKNIT